MEDFKQHYAELSDIFERMNHQFSAVQKDVSVALNESFSGAQRIYLNGTFNAFHASSQLLEIRLEKGIFYYPLKDYEGEYLPVPDSQVLIFQSGIPGQSRILIKAFEHGGRAIAPSKRLNLKVAGLDLQSAELVLQHPLYGQIRVMIPETLMLQSRWARGQFIRVKEIEAVPHTYWCIEEEISESALIDRKGIMNAVIHGN
jgi:hypothetical protein